MNQDWKNDPRVKNMSLEKLNYLVELADKVQKTPKNQLLSVFMALNMDAGKSGMRFSDQETDLLVSILTADMNEGEKKKLDTLRLLSQKLARGKK